MSEVAKALLWSTSGIQRDLLGTVEKMVIPSGHLVQRCLYAKLHELLVRYSVAAFRYSAASPSPLGPYRPGRRSHGLSC